MTITLTINKAYSTNINFIRLSSFLTEKGDTITQVIDDGVTVKNSIYPIVEVAGIKYKTPTNFTIEGLEVWYDTEF